MIPSDYSSWLFLHCNQITFGFFRIPSDVVGWQAERQVAMSRGRWKNSWQKSMERGAQKVPTISTSNTTCYCSSFLLICRTFIFGWICFNFCHIWMLVKWSLFLKRGMQINSYLNLLNFCLLKDRKWLIMLTGMIPINLLQFITWINITLLPTNLCKLWRKRNWNLEHYFKKENLSSSFCWYGLDHVWNKINVCHQEQIVSRWNCMSDIALALPSTIPYGKKYM